MPPSRPSRTRTVLLACALAVLVQPGPPVPAEDAASEAFVAWLAALREEASGRGISAATLDEAFRKVHPIRRVIELDRRQLEFTLRLEEYLERYVSDKRAERGRELLEEHRELLAEVHRRYGVQPRFVAALWGIESNYGRDQGSFPVIGALATLAFDGRRSSFFRGELLDALTILEDGHIEARAMRGSWAGAMGQSQFMPSSFRAYAVDLDGDGRRDIWSSTGDVLGSIANYLARHGWRDEWTWGRPVRLPDRFDAGLIGLGVKKNLSEWQRLGVRRADGGDLPDAALSASISRPDREGPAYLVYDNFRVLMRWNRSEYFGIAVGELADRLQGGAQP